MIDGANGVIDGGRPVHVDPVEAALADALRLASQAGQWNTVEVLSRELSARRLARTAPEVASLDVERIRRKPL